MTDKEKELQAEAIGYYRKRIAELEMTVGTLRNFSNEQATCIERLEKENAELKAFRQDCVKLTEDNVVMARQRAEIARQLTKSKELLKQWLQTSKASGCDNINIITDTEQFLKDSEPQSKWINPVRTTNDNEIKIK